jgi:hypothetical protein
LGTLSSFEVELKRIQTLIMMKSDPLQTAVASAKRRFEQLQGKHPELKVRLPTGAPLATLVLSLPGGQAEIDSSPMQIPTGFPAMILENATKTSALNLLYLQSKDLGGTEAMQAIKQQLSTLLTKLDFDEKCQVEIRFNELRFDLVWKLQTDVLVDRDLTPQTKASIRIVLGTLAQFAAMEK